MSRDARGGGAPGDRRGAAARRALPLVALGGLRLVATSASGYVVPIGEYGAHWNFFFTLAGVAALAALLPPPGRGAVAAAAATAAALLAHGAALHGGLAAWLDAPERGADLLSRNREGLCSVVRQRGGCFVIMPAQHALTCSMARSRATGASIWAA